MNTVIKIGTRKSKLALWQAYFVAELLEKNNIATEIVKIETKGDKILDVSISKIGSKGVFTEEIEDQLLAGDIDIAVHSAKDMQSELPDAFELIAFTEREVPNDVIVSRDKTISLKDSSRQIRIGTSSVRRVAMLKHYYPHVRVVDMRGNLQTRIAKMEAGQCEALLLAYAGVNRMHYNDMIVETLPANQFTPAVGQGSIAVEVAKSLETDKKELIRKHINHTETEYRLKAERAYLKTLQGGCSIPVFALAEIENDRLKITGGIISLDGKTLLKDTFEDQKENAEKLGEKLAAVILQKGGDAILAAIKG